MLLLDAISRDEQFISTFSGKQLSLLAPDASQIDIEDIAHGLAYQCCFNGQTRYYYSVAQHCMLVAQLVPPQHRLAALLHDSGAAYFGDMTCRMRQLLPEFDVIEKRIMAAVGAKYSVSDFAAAPIRRAHLIALATEQRDLVRDAGGADTSRDASAPIPRRIEAMPPEEARFQFSEMFAELIRKTPPQKKLQTVGRELASCTPAEPLRQARQAPSRASQLASLSRNGREWLAPRQLAG